MIRFYYEDIITQILIYIYDCAHYVGDDNDEDISEDNDHDIDNAGDDEDENIVPIAMGFYCQVPLHTQSLNREMMFQILPMAITMKLSLMMNDISDSVPGPINLYRPLPLHHEPLWRQSSGHRCPAKAILWRVQVIKYTS